MSLEKVSKYYRQHFWTKRRKVLDEVSFEVEKGEIFGFLGPNGAGKSTTIKILFEIIFPSSGVARLFGKPVGDRNAKKKIGFLPENPYFYDYLTARQFLEFHGQLCGLSHSRIRKRVGEILELVGMKGTDDIRLRNFSKGMLQRVGLGQAIIHDPELVILDEPMTGLDPVGRKDVRNIMLRLKEEGKTVFFSTHILSDVESICDRVAMMNRGRVVSRGRLDELVNIESKYVEIEWSNSLNEMKTWLERARATQIVSRGERLHLRLDRQENESSEAFEDRVNLLVSEGLQKGGRIRSISPHKESLEDVFVSQMGQMDARV